MVRAAHCIHTSIHVYACNILNNLSGARVQRRSVEWLESNGFFEATGFLIDNIRFCIERSQKAPICRELGITYFIDDRWDIIESMLLDAKQLIWFGPNNPRQIPLRHRELVTICRNWLEVQRVLLPDDAAPEEALAAEQAQQQKDAATPCKVFAKDGTCRFGNECKYSHDVQVGAASGKRAAKPKAKANANAKREVCRNFANGSCAHGNFCKFAHH
jgi:hypothetical protein